MFLEGNCLTTLLRMERYTTHSGSVPRSDKTVSVSVYVLSLFHFFNLFDDILNSEKNAQRTI